MTEKLDADFEFKANDISKIVISCIKEALEEQDDKYPFIPEITTLTILIGKNGILDSHALVSAIVNIEESLDEEYGILITLADEKAMSQERSPFMTVNALIEYITTLINEQK